MKALSSFLFTILFSSLLFSQSVPIVNTGLSGPIDIAIEGNIAYVNEFLGDAISRIDLSVNTPSAEEVITGLSLPTAVLISNNNLYVSEDIGRITRWDATNFDTAPEVITTSLSEPIHMVMNGTDLYVAEFGSSSRIVRIDLANNNAIETLVTGLNVPRQMTIVNNDLYVAESGLDRIIRLDLTITNPTPEVVLDNLLVVSGLFSIGDIIYATEDIDDTGRLLSFDSSLETPSLEIISTNLDGPGGISRYQNDLYIIEQRLDQVSRINDVLSVQENTVENNFSLYPNPNNGHFTIDALQSPIKKVILHDVLGKKVFEQEVNNDVYQFHSDLKKGVYFLTILTEVSKTIKKVIIS